MLVWPTETVDEEQAGLFGNVGMSSSHSPHCRQGLTASLAGDFSSFSIVKKSEVVVVSTSLNFFIEDHLIHPWPARFLCTSSISRFWDKQLQLFLVRL